MEAYRLLAAEKERNESFSKVIKRRLRPGHTAADLLNNLPRLLLSEDALNHVEKTVARRKNSLIDSPVFEEKS